MGDPEPKDPEPKAPEPKAPEPKDPEPKAVPKDPGPDLILEQRNEKGEKILQFVLPNICRQMYTFGSKYPGARDGEEFVFCRFGYEYEHLVEPTHCTISVDEGGNYWVKKATSTAETFVNLEKIEEPRPLKDGDIISLGIPKNCWCKPGPLFHAELRLPDSKIRELESPSESPEETQVQVFDESPFDNELVVSKILDYVPLWELKNFRLVCKKWNQEGSKVLQKKRQVCFTFDGDYGNPQKSTNVFRYLHEMERLKMRKIKIILNPTVPSLFAPGEPGEKMLDDLRTLLNSPHNFSGLALHFFCIYNESSFSILHLILEKLGPKLVELELSGSIEFFPTIPPPLPEMNNLKKLTTRETCVVPVESQKWVSLLVPLFRKNLEQFSICDSGSNDASVLYLEEFLKHEMSKLEGFEIDDCIDEVKLSLLLQLNNHFTYLYLCYSPTEEDDEEVLNKLLLKNSRSLKHLVIDVNNCVTVKFPSFPKLENLHLMYSSEARMQWRSGGVLDYKLHLPSLRNLKIDLFESPFKLEDGDIFSSFFPEGMNSLCETVTQLFIPASKDPEKWEWECEFTVKRWRELEADYKKFQERFTMIKKMFPKVEEIKTEEFYSMDVY